MKKSSSAATPPPMDKQPLVVICTRIDSSRLPGKALKKIAGIPAIEHILIRLGVKKSNAFGQFPVVLAVPHGCFDFDYLISGYYVKIRDGDGESPLHRTAEVIKEQEPKYIIRITHDDVLIDYKTIQAMAEMVKADDSIGYIYSPDIMEGCGVEMVRAENVTDAAERLRFKTEYLSYYIKGDGTPYPRIVPADVRGGIKRSYRLTLDYPEDLSVLESTLRAVGPLASNDDIAAFLDQNPHLLAHNSVPEVSVYTCAYNAEKWIGQTMRSVTASSVTHEYTIVNDASTDQTVLEIINNGSARIIQNDQNIGLASSCNVALKHCRGRYTMRVDADDKIKPWAIEAMVKKAKETGAALVYANFDEIDDNNKIIRRNVNAQENHHAGCCLMESRAINTLRFRDGLRHWDSLELYKRVKNNYKIAYIDEPLWFYRRHARSMSANDKITRGEIKRSLHL